MAVTAALARRQLSVSPPLSRYCVSSTGIVIMDRARTLSHHHHHQKQRQQQQQQRQQQDLSAQRGFATSIARGPVYTSIAVLERHSARHLITNLVSILNQRTNRGDGRELSTSVSASGDADDSDLPVDEARVSALLEEKFGSDSQIEVIDTSGGCGSFFRVTVVSAVFQGKPLVKQHRLVTEALSSVMPKVHGVTIHTKAAAA